MNRRGFLSSILRASAAFSILPSATTYVRKWIASGNILVPSDEIVLSEFPIFDDKIMRNIRFYDEWLVASHGTYSGLPEHITLDRFRQNSG